MMIIKKKYLRISSFLIVLMLGMSFVPGVSASSPPSIPNVFTGNLLADGANAPVGTIISAYIGSELVGWNLITEVGRYELPVNSTEKNNGKTIIFKLGDVDSEPVSATYKYGATPVKLDLSFTGEDFSAIAVGSDELINRYAGSDKVFSAEEIKKIVNNTTISTRMKYAILNIYFADGWDRI